MTSLFRQPTSGPALARRRCAVAALTVVASLFLAGWANRSGYADGLVYTYVAAALLHLAVVVRDLPRVVSRKPDTDL